MYAPCMHDAVVCNDELLCCCFKYWSHRCPRPAYRYISISFCLRALAATPRRPRPARRGRTHARATAIARPACLARTHQCRDPGHVRPVPKGQTAACPHRRRFCVRLVMRVPVACLLRVRRGRFLRETRRIVVRAERARWHMEPGGLCVRSVIRVSIPVVNESACCL